MYCHTRKTLQSLLVLACFMALMFEFTGCSNDDSPGPDNTGDNVMLNNNSTHGNILVDADGKTLYFFTKDVAGTSKCAEGTCLTNWPLFYAEEIRPGEGLDENDFATITRDDGEEQTTYKGWPLYYFAGDNAAGETNGDGVNSVWFVAKPDYSIMIANAQLKGHDSKNYTSNYQEGNGETQYFVDGQGRTLYTFKNDFKDDNNFTASDFSNNAVWPVFYVDIESLPSALSAADFGEIDVFGEEQITYKGWPLYYFGQDANRGDNKGVSFPSPGVWPIANLQTTTAPERPTVKLTSNTELGDVLTDYEGHTLYFFTRDANGTSACAGGCLDKWPIFNAEEIILPAGSTLEEDDFGFIGDGATRQVTYNGWPLYYYAPNSDGVIEAAAETGGQGIGNVWYVAKDYSLMYANAQLVGNDGKNYTSAYVEGDGLTRYFTDGYGRTIYLFTNDSKDTNTFTNGDAGHDGAWPIFYVSPDQLPAGMDAADFGTIEVFGNMQLTFRGWPLYYFGADTERGQNKGVSVPVPGKWPVINNDTQSAPE